MSRYIKIKIPYELKRQFNEDKKFLIENNLNNCDRVQKIQNALDSDNIVYVMNEIASINDYFERYFGISLEGFYKYYLLWLEYVLLQIMRFYHIELHTSFQKSDMYLCLQSANIVLSSVLSFKDAKYKADDLINMTQSYTTLLIKDTRYNKQLRKICSAFIDVGLGGVNIEDKIDLRYSKNVNPKKLKYYKYNV